MQQAILEIDPRHVVIEHCLMQVRGVHHADSNARGSATDDKTNLVAREESRQHNGC